MRKIIFTGLVWILILVVMMQSPHVVLTRAGVGLDLATYDTSGRYDITISSPKEVVQLESFTVNVTVKVTGIKEGSFYNITILEIIRGIELQVKEAGLIQRADIINVTVTNTNVSFMEPQPIYEINMTEPLIVSFTFQPPLLAAGTYTIVARVNVDIVALAGLAVSTFRTFIIEETTLTVKASPTAAAVESSKSLVSDAVTTLNVMGMLLASGLLATMIITDKIRRKE